MIAIVVVVVCVSKRERHVLVLVRFVFQQSLSFSFTIDPYVQMTVDISISFILTGRPSLSPFTSFCILFAYIFISDEPVPLS